jgi:hypothetical protein
MCGQNIVAISLVPEKLVSSTTEKCLWEATLERWTEWNAHNILSVTIRKIRSNWLARRLSSLVLGMPLRDTYKCWYNFIKDYVQQRHSTARTFAIWFVWFVRPLHLWSSLCSTRSWTNWSLKPD